MYRLEFLGTNPERLHPYSIDLKIHANCQHFIKKSNQVNSIIVFVFPQLFEKSSESVFSCIVSGFI